MISKWISRELFVDRNDLSRYILLRMWLINCTYFLYRRFVHAAQIQTAWERHLLFAFTWWCFLLRQGVCCLNDLNLDFWLPVLLYFNTNLEKTLKREFKEDDIESMWIKQKYSFMKFFKLNLTLITIYFYFFIYN